MSSSVRVIGRKTNCMFVANEVLEAILHLAKCKAAGMDGICTKNIIFGFVRGKVCYKYATGFYMTQHYMQII